MGRKRRHVDAYTSYGHGPEGQAWYSKGSDIKVLPKGVAHAERATAGIADFLGRIDHRKKVITLVPTPRAARKKLPYFRKLLKQTYPGYRVKLYEDVGNPDTPEGLAEAHRAP